jgi:hypothetical protein
VPFWNELLKVQTRALEIIRSNRILFYPGSGTDWQPLRSSAAGCDLFAYCDWNTSLEDFHRAAAELSLPESATQEDLDDSVIRSGLDGEIGGLEKLPWVKANPGSHDTRPWRRFRIVSPNADKSLSSAVGLLFIHASPIDAYRALFTERKVVPRQIYFKKKPAFSNAEWNYLVYKYGDFAGTVRATPPKPREILINGVPTADWP